jgi:hypothetical protein
MFIEIFNFLAEISRDTLLWNIITVCPAEHPAGDWIVDVASTEHLIIHQNDVTAVWCLHIQMMS